MADTIRLRQIATELRLLPQTLGEMYGHLEVMCQGAVLVREAYQEGAFRGDSPLAELGLRILHFINLRYNPENAAVQEGLEPEWRSHVWYCAVYDIAPEVFDNGTDTQAICLAVGPVADAIEREADRISDGLAAKGGHSGSKDNGKPAEAVWIGDDKVQVGDEVLLLEIQFAPCLLSQSGSPL